VLHTLPKTPCWRSASQLAYATDAQICKCLFSKTVEPARLRVSLYLLIELPGVELLEPSTKSRQLIRRQFRHGLFDVF
jgi:hypothetical protein